MAELDVLNEPASPESSPVRFPLRRKPEKQPFGAISPSDLAELGIDPGNARKISGCGFVTIANRLAQRPHLDPRTPAGKMVYR